MKEELINRKQNEAETRKAKKSRTINPVKLTSPIKEQIGAILVPHKAEHNNRSFEQDKEGYYILIKSKYM